MPGTSNLIFFKESQVARVEEDLHPNLWKVPVWHSQSTFEEEVEGKTGGCC